ncbi:MAG: hypothetical protein CBB74_03615 [Owenweeksia sp. TMED14]|nr:MAG: hypothetical protein CBB74_03615 [Owenweeksia sp. TMED14]
MRPFPIPASDFINIPLRNIQGSGELRIFDLAGNMVLHESNIQSNGDMLKVNVSGLASGSYIFNLSLDNGNSTSFTVIVNR